MDRKPLSPEDMSILDMLVREFADVPRPSHFTNFTHCDECAEHDQTLMSRDRDTVQRDDLGNIGWDPITFATSHGFAYYFPALARIALEDDPSERSNDWYLAMLLSQLSPSRTHEERKMYLSESQRRAVAEFLGHVVRTRANLLKHKNEIDEANQACDVWGTNAI